MSNAGGLQASTGRRGGGRRGAGACWWTEQLELSPSVWQGVLKFPLHTQITPYFPSSSSSSFPALLALFLLLLLLLLLLPAGCCCTSEALMGRADRMDKQVNCWMRTHTHPHTHKHTHTHLCAQRNTLLHYISNTH